jgi:hypothetical protein
MTLEAIIGLNRTELMRRRTRIRKENAPHVMAIFRHVASNLLQAAKKERQSIKGLRKLCGWDDATLERVISKKSS